MVPVSAATCLNVIDLRQNILLDMIVPQATVNYVVAISGVTASKREEYHFYIVDEI
jgi:hypothetical protein